MRRLSEQRGLTLVELLVASTLMLIVMSATLTTFDRFYSHNARANRLNDAQDTARLSMESLARQMRNLANPSPTTPKAIDLFQSYDLIFKTSDPSRRRVRYCLNNATPGNEKIWQQFQAVASVSTPDTTLTSADYATCPVAVQAGGTWATARVVADHIVNRIVPTGSSVAKDRPIFQYDQPLNADSSKVRVIRMAIWLDVNSDVKAPSETTLSSAVFLRNQNQKPTASFTWTAGSGGHSVILNGSGSNDPEGRSLTYRWYAGTYPGACPAATPSSTSNYKKLGTGVTLSPSFTAAGNQTITLEVTDPGSLCDFNTQTVTVP